MAPPSFGPSADISLHAQRHRAQRGITPFPTRFAFDLRSYPPDFFAAVSRAYNIRPNVTFTGDAIARIVVTALLYYCQAHGSSQMRVWVMGDLRTSGLYDGDLLSVLVEAVQSGRVPSRGGMGSYMPSGRGSRGSGAGRGGEEDRMWRDGYFFTAEGVEMLP